MLNGQDFVATVQEMYKSPGIVTGGGGGVGARTDRNHGDKAPSFARGMYYLRFAPMMFAPQFSVAVHFHIRHQAWRLGSEGVAYRPARATGPMGNPKPSTSREEATLRGDVELISQPGQRKESSPIN